MGGAVVAEPLWAGNIGFVGIDMNSAILLEDDLAGGDAVEGVVFADADIESWGELGAALTDDDGAWFGCFAAVEFDSAVLWVGVAAVLG